MSDYRFNLQYANGKYTVDRSDIGTMEVVSAWTYDKAVQENADINTRLKTAEREKKEILDQCIAQNQIVQQLAEEKFGGNWDGEIIFSSMLVFKDGVKTDGVTTGAFIRYDLYQDIEQERDNLQAQVRELEDQVIKKLAKEAKFCHDCQQNYETQVKEWEEKYKQSCVKRSDDIEKLLDLQAAYGVILDTIKAVREDIIYHNQVRFAGGEIFNLITPETAGKIEKAFHYTPERAGERVQGLVDVLELVIKNYDTLWDFNNQQVEGFKIGTYEMLNNALAKFREGADGE